MTDLKELIGQLEALAPEDEVVTQAHLRKVALPGPQGRAEGVLGLITLDNGLDHTRPNTFGPRSMIALNAAIDEALADDEIQAIGVTGKQFILAAGADLSALAATGPEGVNAMAQLGHAVFRKLTEGDGQHGGKPSFGFINGLALGGGLEIGLHCTYRTILDTAAAVGLPEVMLGLIPGWGGAYLLPNLIGPEKAAKVILENPLNQGRVLNGAQAFELGIADACFGGVDYLEDSLRWAADVLAGRIVIERPEVDKGQAWDDAIDMAGWIAQGKTGGASPAAAKAVELLRGAKTATRDEAFAAEDAALTEMASTPELLASLYAFDLVQKRAKRPAGAPDRSLARPITKVGIVGAGLMASQLALLFEQRLKVPVVLTDLDQERADKGVAYVHGELDKRLAAGKASPDGTNRLKALVTGSMDQQSAFADADFVIEAVFEEMSVKKQVFATVEKFVSPETILATNTSSLSITEMAADLEHPERVVGFHFFNPVAVMPLVEIVKGERTGDVALATAFATGKALRKTTILVQDSPSFIVNRLLGRFMSETGRAADGGTPLEVIDSAFGGIAPMPPYMLLSLVGPAIALHNGETLAKAFPDRFYVSENLRTLVERKLPGVYGSDGKIDPEITALFQPAGEQVELTAEQVRAKALEGLADEARRMLDEGVVAAPEDLDLAMITGAGFSFWNGGLTMLLDREGVSEKVTGKTFH